MKKRSIITLIVIFGGLFVGLIIFIAVLMVAFGADTSRLNEPSIGVVEVDGSIMESEEVVQQLRDFEEEEQIRGVIVRVNSPGGAVAPSQEIYQAVRRLGEEKPVVVSMGTVAASGGYYVACGGEKIFANSGTITGSIGVITQFFNVERLVERVDLEVHTVKSGEYKDAGSPFRPFEPQDEAIFSEMVFDIHDQFVEDIAECRDLDRSQVAQVADGRVFTGRQAVDLELVDEIGSLRDAVDYLSAELGLDDPPLVYPPEERLGFFSELFSVAIDSSITEAKDQTRPRIKYEYVGPQ